MPGVVVCITAVNIVCPLDCPIPQAPVTLNYVLGPISTPARRLLFADRNGIVPVQLANRLALRDESEAESLEVREAERVCRQPCQPFPQP